MSSLRCFRITSAVAVVVAVSVAPASAVTRRAFVTSSAGSANFIVWPGDLDDGLLGIAAANRICQNSAEASVLSIPNPELFRAWISDSETDAYCNVLGFTGKKADNCGQPTLPPADIGPWRMANGASAFAGALGDLLDGSTAIYLPLSRDENFAAVPSLASAEIWTATSPGGTKAGSSTCSNWAYGGPVSSTLVGNAFGSSLYWTSWQSGTCDGVRRLLCLESGAGDPIPLLWNPASLMFVTSQKYSADLGSSPEAGGATGIAAGDAICRARAVAGHLPAPESFVSWLGDGVLEPAARIASNGPFKRIDGFTVANSKADLLDGTIATTVHQDELGIYAGDGAIFFGGADAHGETLPNHCDGWTDDTILDKRVGRGGMARDPIWADDGVTYSCEFAERLLCVSNVVTIFWDGFDRTGDASRWSSVTP